MSVKTYYKKPVKVKSLQWNGKNLNDVAEFVGDCLGPIERRPDYKIRVRGKNDPRWLFVDIDVGDYIVQDLCGEFHIKSEKWFMEEFVSENTTILEIEKLRADREKLVEALRFYANGDCFNPDLDSRREEWDSDQCNADSDALFKGKLARTTLKELGEMEEE